MARVFRSLLELIFLTIAIAIILPHAQSVWNGHYKSGWWVAFSSEWHIAWPAMLIGIIVLIMVLISEPIFAWLEIRGQRKTEGRADRRWKALFKRFGIDDPVEEDEDNKSRKNKAKKQRW